MTFSKNLKNLRAGADIGQATLAEKVNVSLKTISHWETGYTESSIAQLIMLAEIFGVTIDDLVGKEEKAKK
ncbi:MAG: helix-turn-helix transcriptional regulator [Clostridia bacterium]|nr:helix-turn-helix transcriptional regulator [Clostridia bacterium]